MQTLKKSILKVVAYFDLFNYPVTYDEIKFFLDRPVKENALLADIQDLADAAMLYRMNGYYALKPDYSMVERRITGNRAAEKKLKFAARIARFLSRFPYIRGVAISGSLSKNFAYKGSDIDFFIITAPNRLWVARMIFLCFFYIAKLVGLRNWFCLNYFIDTASLEIPEKNIYTAIEIATLMPRQGSAAYKDFYAHNAWVYNYLPNYLPAYEDAADHKKGLVKTTVEWLLNNKAGDRLDNFLCRFYRNRWKKMLDKKTFAKNGFQFGSYIAGRHVCKPMPHYFQARVLTRLDEKMNELESKLIVPQQIAV